LGYAWQASLTLRGACARLERFVRLVNDKARIRIEDHDGCLVMSMEINLESQCQTARDDCELALVTLMCRSICTNDFRLHSVSFRHAAPKDIKPYFEFFGCQLKFDQPVNQLLIPLRFVDDVLTGANPELALMNDKVIIRHLAMIDKGDIVSQVQAVMMDQLPLGQISDDSVANALHMSVRTMHRKLADVDNSFRSLLVDIRRELAETYILDNSLTLTEISLLLGFSEQSSFSRAFKSWTGSAPSEARQAAGRPQDLNH
jgi:AraC-like DNA-binding protein